MTCAKMPAMDAATRRSEEEENNEREVNLIYHPKMSLNHCHHSQQEAGGNKINSNIANNTSFFLN